MSMSHREMTFNSAGSSKATGLARRRPFIAGAAALFLAVAVSGVCARGAYAQDAAPDAKAKGTACQTTISACGCVITKADLYTLSGTFAAGSTFNADGSCIEVAAPNVDLNLNGATITGTSSSSGIGVFFLKRANNGVLEGFDATISKFEVGLQIESNNILTDYFTTNSNTTGILIHGVHGGAITDFTSDSNTNGVVIEDTTGSNINTFTAGSNTNYGVWVESSSNDQINDFNTQKNGGTGTYVGCAATGGPSGARCTSGGRPSNNNRIYDAFSGSNGGDGIAIDLGDSGNLVTDIDATSNTGDDAVDENPSCDHNLWFGNSITKAGSSCIH
ncbi:MAG TPA: hypothetical protein VNF29_03165 [Candidatus Binataceae bacterium]|nr:hypothetical protein [Candidatus Binataceae bacterium]